MKILLAPVLGILLFAAFAGDSSAKSYKDSDWNWSGQNNCRPPRNDSIQWMQEGDRRFLRVQLRDGDIGKCQTDNDASHSKRFGKPWSERAEIKGRAFGDNGASYRIAFDIRFVQGFDQDQLSETFFQIKDCPDSRVPVLAKLGGWKKRNGGRSKVGFSLAAGTPGEVYKSSFLGRDPVDRRWHRIEAWFETGPKHYLTVKFDGQTWLPRTAFGNAFSCGQPSLRLGIYRSGDPGTNAHSIVDYDRVNIEKIK